MNTTWNILFGQLLTASPVLLAYLGLIVASLMYWSRHPQVCLLGFIAGLLMLLSTLGQMYFSAYMVQARMSSGGTVQQTAMVMGVVTIATSVLRAAGIALLTWAVFAGRANDVPVAMRFETLPPR
jgi:hypothetical protein